MRKLLALALVIALVVPALFSCAPNDKPDDSDSGDHQCETPNLKQGNNGNWWLGDEDTGIPVSPTSIEITKVVTEFVTINGTEYSKVTITLSDGTKREFLSELLSDPSAPSNPSDGDDAEAGEIFVSVASITNGYNGTNGIVCLMTDNDSGKFESLALLDELYIKYGLVAGLGTVVKNLYTDSSYTVPKSGVVSKTQEFLDTGRWKIINHSMTHSTYCEVVNGEKVINEDRLRDEVITSQAHLRELFPNEKVLTYAMMGTTSALGENYDPNDLRARERELIADYYIGGRYQEASSTAFDDLVWNNLPTDLLQRSNLDTILTNIDAAANDGKYYMIYNHYVIEDELFDTVNESSWTNKSTVEALCKRVARYVEDGSLWNAHFEDAVMYMRERETASVSASFKDGKLDVTLTDEMDDTIYNHPLTVKLTVPENWDNVKITQNGSASYAKVVNNDGERYVLANIVPDKGVATLEAIAAKDVPEETKPQVKPTPDITTSSPAIPSDEIPDVYTYETLEGYLGSLITFDNAGTDTSKLSVVPEGENNVLKMEKSEGDGSTTVNLIGKPLTGATYFVAETKIKLNRTSQGGQVYIVLKDTLDNWAYTAYIDVKSDNTLALTDYRHDASSSVTSKKFGAHGEYLNLKIVYTVNDGAASITIYADGDEVLTSSNHFQANSTPIAADKIGVVQFNFSRAYLGELYLDDTVMKATSTSPVVEVPDVYTYETLEGYLGSLITFDNAGTDTSKLSVVPEGENNVLKMEKSEGDGSTTINIKGKPQTGATSFVAETKMKINRASSEGNVYIGLMNTRGNYAYQAYIHFNSDNTLELVDFRHGDSSRATSTSFGIHGEYLSLKIVYTVNGGAASITIYADGDEVLTSSNHYEAASEPMAADEIGVMQFCFSRAYQGELYLDDTALKTTD